MADFLGEGDALVTNTETRLPVCLCLDTSGSMYDCINELNDAVKIFYEEIMKNEQAAHSCEVAIVTFDSNVTLAEDFSTVEERGRPNFRANGGTDMTGGIKLALQKLDERKAEYKAVGREYFQPWLVVMSDGEPNDRNSIPYADIEQRVKEKKLTVFGVGIGPGADMDVLKRIAGPKAFKIKENKFSEFFEWLGKSTVHVSQSNPNEKTTLPKPDPGKDFFDIDL